MSEYFPIIDFLIEYLNKHKFEVEDTALKYDLHHSAVKLEDIKAMLQLFEQLTKILKVLIKL